MNNRVFGVVREVKSQQIVIDGTRFANPKEQWKGAGTAIPVFGIRTEDDFGVGDFLDIKKMVDWCVKTGQKVLQILPINDTTMTGTWVDSYPIRRTPFSHYTRCIFVPKLSADSKMTRKRIFRRNQKGTQRSRGD